MQLVVTFEMAQKLKKAGFPQPKFSPGQTWYNEQGTALNIESILGNLIFKPWDGRINGWLYENAPPTGEAFFAPTAERLLANLPESYRNLEDKPVKEGLVLGTPQKIELADPDAYGQMWIDENIGSDDNDGVEWLDMKV